MSSKAFDECIHCKMSTTERNPSGFCDHLYYPENCSICEMMISDNKRLEKYRSTDKFVRLFQIVKIWFDDEGVLVADTVLGRMAARLKELLEKEMDSEDKEIVICAAIKINDSTIIRGHRHNNAIRTASEYGWTPTETRAAIQGFITSRNRFVDRKEGREIQSHAGIPSANKTGYFDNELYSEDLY